MRLYFQIVLALAIALFSSSIVLADDSNLTLVSDNITANTWMMLLPTDTSKTITGATYQLIKEGPYATDPSTVSTDEGGINAAEKQDSMGKSAFFDGRWIFSSSRTFSEWSGGQWISIIIDLKKQYPIAKTQVWSLVDSSCFTEGYEVLTSDDGVNFTSQSKFNNKTPREAMMFVRTDGYLPSAVNARYVQLRIHRLPEAFQQQIGEIAIWAVKPDQSYVPVASELKPVKFDVQMVGSGAAKIDWSNFKADVVAWKIYRSDKSAEDLQQNARPVATVSGTTSNYLLYPITPKTTTWISVSAIYNGSGEESPRTQPVKLTTPGVFECKTFGDMLAVNHFPNGGGAHVNRANEQEWQIVALDMLARTPFKDIRWWRQDEFWVKKFYERGIGLLVSRGPDTANPLGIYGFSIGAEPDLNGITPKAFLETLKAEYASLKAANPANVVTAPTSGTEQHSIDWLEALYKEGAKDYFDVLDLHPYCKTSGGHKVPQGIPAGAPEALLSDIAKVKAIMAAHGDANKPMIATELGYPTTIYGNPTGQITKEIQSQYIVRALVLCHVLGFKKVYWYSFFDEGTSIYDPEHNYGLIDYYMQAKPAYYSLITLGQQIGKGTYAGSVKGAKSPVFGYTYKVGSEYVSVIWDGGGACAADIAVRDKSVTIVDLMGEEHTAVPVNGKLRTKLGPGAVYIHSQNPVTIVSTKRIASSEEREVKIDVPRDVFIVASGRSANMTVSIANSLLNNISGYAELVDAKGKVINRKKFAVKSGAKTALAFTIKPGPVSPSLTSNNLNIVYNWELDSVSRTKQIWIRTLTKPVPGKVTVRKMTAPGLTEPMLVMSNEFLEVSTAPGVGGRIVEIIDRKTLTNQVRIDYSQLKGLAQLQWAYTYWDTFNNELKNAEYESTTTPSGFVLTADGKGFRASKTFSMSAGKSEFRYDIAFTNTSSESKDITYRCHNEYNVGGTADNVNDVILLPTTSGLTKIPVWLGLGARTHSPLKSGWGAIYDKKQKMLFGQKFDLSVIEDVSLWLGESYYNLEVSGRRITLSPGETGKIPTTFFLQHGDKGASGPAEVRNQK